MLNFKDIIFPLTHFDYVYDINNKPIKNGNLISYYSGEYSYSYINRFYAILEYILINNKNAILLHAYRSSCHLNIFYINKIEPVKFILEDINNIVFQSKEERLFYFKKIKSINYREKWKNIPNFNYDENGIYLNSFNHKEYIWTEKPFNKPYIINLLKYRE